jgi:hypothetical protein
MRTRLPLLLIALTAVIALPVHAQTKASKPATPPPDVASGPAAKD